MNPNLLKHIPLVLYSCIFTHFILKCTQRLRSISTPSIHNLLLYYTKYGFFILGEDVPEDVQEISRCTGHDNVHQYCTSMSIPQLQSLTTPITVLSILDIDTCHLNPYIPLFLTNISSYASQRLKRKSAELCLKLLLKLNNPGNTPTRYRNEVPNLQRILLGKAKGYLNHIPLSPDDLIIPKH